MRKVFVTGGAGFIGSHLIEQLLKKGFAVRCLVRETTDLKWLEDFDVEYIYGDLKDYQTIESAIKKVDTVFHLAGKTRSRTEEGFYQANAVGTMNLLKAAIQVNPGLQRFIYVSSLAAVGPSPTGKILNESDTPNPLSPYGSSKLAGEEAVMAFKTQIPVTIIRPPIVYGPRDPDTFKFFRWIPKGIKPVMGFRVRYLSFIFVDDLIRGLLIAAESKKAVGEAYFVVSDNRISYQDVNRITAGILRKKAITLHVPISFLSTASLLREMIQQGKERPVYLDKSKIRELRHRYWICDGGKAKKELNFTPKIALPEGIERTFAWYEEMGWK